MQEDSWQVPLRSLVAPLIFQPRAQLSGPQLCSASTSTRSRRALLAPSSQPAAMNAEQEVSLRKARNALRLQKTVGLLTVAYTKSARVPLPFCGARNHNCAVFSCRTHRPLPLPLPRLLLESHRHRPAAAPPPPPGCHRCAALLDVSHSLAAQTLLFGCSDVGVRRSRRSWACP